ncbi:fluoroquinolone transport system ATP-binding protein [Lipingzhangella halophila]|uniref:Fluoroquinolone transport system ATP-binding protein n=1 Tax=Lipingzhangella halophila TaxID=1783352 RepID=A0A7W7W1K5_9ACTN|nr:ABC transporter ATP-binding protein [Lipingzhangella halophila]MBB4930751.1 fluoroquinolone transport system ATP-binding protein [Lipingzhangella halophila]
MSGPVIDVHGLRVRYRGSAAPAVDGMTFGVRTGEIFGFLGPSGAGKSTVQKVLTRLLRRYEGRVEVLGRPLTGWHSDYYERIGVGFELPAQFSKLTGRENLTAFARLYSGATESPGYLLDLVGLGDAADQRAGTYSKGMRLRLNLARALINRPELLFLDEPTSGQDPVHAESVRAIIRAQAAAGRTVVLTTHDMATADQLCDRVAFVSRGRLAAVDAPRELKRVHGRPGVVVEYRADGQLGRREFGVDSIATDPSFARLANDGVIETIHTREASLDQVFAAVTAETL